MKIYVDNYSITKATMAILVNYDPNYQSLILEPNKLIYCKLPTIAIVKQGCIEGGATYNGRKAAIEKLLHTRSKLPIPINQGYAIFFFPTRSPRNIDCNWISFYHVKRFQGQDLGTNIKFSDGSIHYFNISLFSMKRQMAMTSMLVVLLDKPFPPAGEE